MTMLIANSTIFFHNHQYLPGEILPEDAVMKPLWLESGAAHEETVEEAKEHAKAPKAKRRSAKAGLPGEASGDLESDENLVGRIPENPVRKRK